MGDGGGVFVGADALPHAGAAPGAEDVALYVGLVAVAVCLVLLLLVGVLVYCRKKGGLDADVADSSILTAGFQPVSIKPSKAGELRGQHRAGTWRPSGAGGGCAPGGALRRGCVPRGVPGPEWSSVP